MNFKRGPPEVHQITDAPLCKNVPLCLVDSLWGASIHASTASRKYCSLMDEAPGAKHVDLGLTDSCEGFDWTAVWARWAGWACTGESGSTWPLDPKPGHVGPPWSNQNDSPAWVVLQVRQQFAQDGYSWEGMSPDPAMVGREHRLPRPGGLELVTQTGSVSNS